MTKCKVLVAQGQQHWVQWNAMTERYEFLHLTRAFQEKFQKSWEIVSARAIKRMDGNEGSEVKGSKGEGSKSKGIKGSRGKGSKASEASQASEGDKTSEGMHKGKRHIKDMEGIQDSTKKPKNTLDALLAMAWKTKARWYAVQGTCAAFKATAQNDEAIHIILLVGVITLIRDIDAFWVKHVGFARCG